MRVFLLLVALSALLLIQAGSSAAYEAALPSRTLTEALERAEIAQRC
jgi:hypothetical protein